MIPFLLHAPDDVGDDADGDGDEKGEWENGTERNGERGARLIDDTQLTTQHVYRTTRKDVSQEMEGN